MALTEEQRAKLNAKSQQKQSGFSQNDYDEYQEFLRFKEMKQQQAQYQHQDAYQASQYSQNTYQQPLQNDFEQSVQPSVMQKVGKDGLTIRQRIMGWIIFLVLIMIVYAFVNTGKTSKTQTPEQSQQAVTQQDRTNTSADVSVAQPKDVESESQVVDRNVEQPSVVEEQPQQSVTMAMSEQEFRNSCQEFNYKEIARNPDAFVGQHFKVEVQIFNTDNGGMFSGYDKCYKAFTKMDNEYLSDVYMGDMIFLLDEMDTQSPSYFKVLDEDIIVAYCTFEGMVETSNWLTSSNSESIALHMYYADLISE